MAETAPSLPPGRWQRLDKAQLVKWIIYSLLIVNWMFYAWQEWSWAQHTLRHDATFQEILEAFTTTIDELAWFGLLFMFELETYALDDEAFEKRWVGWTLHGARLVCYVGLAHTVFANSVGFHDAWNAPQADGVTHLCQVADGDMSWGSNYDYREITAENCASFTEDTQFRMIDPLVITDSAGWAMEKKQTLISLIDSIVWLLVIWAVELAIWLQNRNITGGTLMIVSHAAKALYAWLFVDAAFWLFTGHPVWAWDQVLWICGFWVIERNLSEWRDDIRDEEVARERGAAPTHA